MIKQGIKTMNSGFIRTYALFQLPFVQFRPYEISFLRLLLSLALIPKSKKTLEMSWDIIPLFKTSLDARVEGLVLNVDYIKNQCYNFIQKKQTEKDIWHAHTFHSLDHNFSFCTDFLHQ